MSNVQQSAIAMIHEMKSSTMKSSNVVVYGGVCAMLDQGGWWCMHNDEAGCMEVWAHYDSGAWQWCMHTITMLCDSATNLLWHWCSIVWQCWAHVMAMVQCVHTV